MRNVAHVGRYLKCEAMAAQLIAGNEAIEGLDVNIFLLFHARRTNMTINLANDKSLTSHKICQ